MTIVFVWNGRENIARLKIWYAKPFGTCIGRVAWSTTYFIPCGNIPIVTMGPICIAPQYKRRGYGKILSDASLEAAKHGYGAVCFEGNIDFYGKSGFPYARPFGIRYHGLPEDADTSFLVCKELKEGYPDGITGEYTHPRHCIW